MNTTVQPDNDECAVFGADTDKAANYQARASLMMQLDAWISRENLTQTAAAERLGITQNRVSDLMRGKVDRFSVDLLINLLARAGYAVRLDIREAT